MRPVSTKPSFACSLSEASLSAAMPPSNERWPYPWVAVCPEPGSARRRMRTSTFYINPEPNHDCEAPVPVLPTSWSAMKSLYGG